MRFLLANNHCISRTSTGETQSLRAIMRWLLDAGHECHALTTARFPSETSTVEQHLSELRVPVAAEPSTPGECPVMRYSIDGLPITLLMTRHNDEAKPDENESLQYQRLFEELLIQFAPDQVIACNGHPMIFRALALARQHGITTVFTLRGPGYYDHRYYQSVDHVFTTSKYITDLHFSKIGLISTPIDSPIQWSEVLAPRESRAFVTFVNPVLIKGLMLFARLADMLGSRRPDIPVLVVQSVASAGSLNSIPGLDFTAYPQIVAAPAVARPAEFFELTRILVVPSLEEAFGRVAAEAMVNSIPPVVSNRGHLPEVVGGDFFRSGGGGLVVPVPDWLNGSSTRLPSEAEVEPWFNAVCNLWDDTDLYQEVATRAFQIATERYGEQVLRKRYVEYLTSLKPGGRVFA